MNIRLIEPTTMKLRLVRRGVFVVLLAMGVAHPAFCQDSPIPPDAHDPTDDSGFKCVNPKPPDPEDDKTTAGSKLDPDKYSPPYDPNDPNPCHYRRESQESVT